MSIRSPDSLSSINNKQFVDASTDVSVSTPLLPHSEDVLAPSSSNSCGCLASVCNAVTSFLKIVFRFFSACLCGGQNVQNTHTEMQPLTPLSGRPELQPLIDDVVAIQHRFIPADGELRYTLLASSDFDVNLEMLRVLAKKHTGAFHLTVVLEGKGPSREEMEKRFRDILPSNSVQIDYFESREAYTSSLHTTPHIVTYFSFEGTKVELNRAFSSWLGKIASATVLYIATERGVFRPSGIAGDACTIISAETV